MPAPILNKGVHESLVASARKGLPKRACAGIAGVSLRSFQKWLEKGRLAAEAEEEGEEFLTEHEKYIDLYRDVEKAVSMRMAELQDEIDNNDEKVGMWMRKAWLLERAWPDVYGPPASRIVHEGMIEHRQTLELPQETALAMHELFSKMVKPKALTEGDGRSG